MRQAPSRTPVSPTVASTVQSFKRHLRAENYRPKTQKVYTEAADQFAAFLPEKGMPQTLTGVKREHVEAWIESLLQQFKPATANQRYRSLQASDEPIDNLTEAAPSVCTRIDRQT